MNEYGYRPWYFQFHIMYRINQDFSRKFWHIQYYSWYFILYIWKLLTWRYKSKAVPSYSKKKSIWNTIEMRIIVYYLMNGIIIHFHSLKFSIPYISFLDEFNHFDWCRHGADRTCTLRYNLILVSVGQLYRLLYFL